MFLSVEFRLDNQLNLRDWHWSHVSVS